LPEPSGKPVLTSGGMPETDLLPPDTAAWWTT
jgi:hypothetical protein